MITFADNVAELTSHRDRELLDVALVRALSDLMRPRMVSIHRCVGDVDDRRWLNRARLVSGDAITTPARPWSELESLPNVVPGDEKYAALTERRVQLISGPTHRAFFPLVSGNSVLAVVEIETETQLEDFAQQTIHAVLRIQGNFERLLDDSERDTLTGLLNRKTFDECFMKIALLPVPVEPVPGELRRHDSEAAGYWLGMIDIDHFKRVNDRFGHPIGDEVLLLFARLLRSNFRFGDHLYRFGGEEFVVLLRCSDEAGAVLAFERLRVATEGHEFPQVGRVTVSIGFTQIDKNDTPNSAFERADRAVYYAKSQGRNKVFSHDALVASGVLEVDHKVGGVEIF